MPPKRNTDLDNKVKKLSPIMSDQNAAGALGLSLATYRKRRQRLGIKKGCGRGHKEVIN